MSQLITSISTLIRTENEWATLNPIIATNTGAYSKDTHMLRIGDGIHKWSELQAKEIVDYVGPHASMHMYGGRDELPIFAIDGSLKTDILPIGDAGTVPFSTGKTDRVAYSQLLVKGYVCETEEEVIQAKAYSPDMGVVFNNWIRFSHNSTEVQPANPAELETWAYNASTSTINNTTNSKTFIGCVSLDKYIKYEHEVKLTSSINDDDYIGVIIAYAKDKNGVEHTLSAIRSPGGQFLGLGNWMVVYDLSQQTQWILSDLTSIVQWGNGAYGATATESGYVHNTPGWMGLPDGVKLYVKRDNDTITVKTTDFTDATYTYLDNAVITIDLNSDARLALFRQNCSIGYCTQSQANSTWSDIVFTDPTGYIYNLQTSTVEKYNSTTSSWEVITDVSIYDVIGIGKISYNPLTKKSFFVMDGQILNITAGITVNDVASTIDNVSLVKQNDTIKAVQLATARSIDGVNFTGAATVTHFATCTTAAATAAKVAAVANFVLVTGAQVLIKFTIANTATNPTININNTGAKAIYYQGAPISSDFIEANTVYHLVYNGTQYEMIGSNASGVHKGTSAPTNTSKLWINTSNNTMNYWNGSDWISIVGVFSTL